MVILSSLMKGPILLLLLVGLRHIRIGVPLLMEKFLEVFNLRRLLMRKPLQKKSLGTTLEARYTLLDMIWVELRQRKRHKLIRLLLLAGQHSEQAVFLEIQLLVYRIL